MGLMPMIEQMITFGDSSTIIIDLKADKNELLSTALAARAEVEKRTGRRMPLRVFSLEHGTFTHMFNPFNTAGWVARSTLEKTDILCAAAGLAYGNEYGRAFFTSANAAVVTSASLMNPGALLFAQLYKEISSILMDDTRILPRETKNAGVHAMNVFSRLASIESLNVTRGGSRPEEVLSNHIDLVECFKSPQIVYFKLPSMISALEAGAIARLALYFLLVSGASRNRSIPVNVFIDEFQRMATQSLDHLFQMSRGLDMRLILANQSMSDLIAAGPSLLEAIETNCGIRQWFSVSTAKDIANVASLFGTREEVDVSFHDGGERSSTITRLVEKPRISTTDLHTISDNPHLSVMQITGLRSGYARYRGIPFVVTSDFHISRDEYQRRCNFGWPPGGLEGALLHVGRMCKRRFWGARS